MRGYRDHEFHLAIDIQNPKVDSRASGDRDAMLVLRSLCEQFLQLLTVLLHEMVRHMGVVGGTFDVLAAVFAFHERVGPVLLLSPGHE